MSNSNRLLYMLMLLHLCFCGISKAYAMEPDEEALRNPKFVEQYSCSTDYFLLRGYFENDFWVSAMQVIDSLQGRGYVDKALTVAKAKIYFKTRSYERAVESFKQALGESYRCRLVSPRLGFAPVPKLADDGIIWFYIYQAYSGMGEREMASVAYDKAEGYLRKSHELPGADWLKNEKSTKDFIEKIFSAYSLYRQPLRPFNPW